MNRRGPGHRTGGAGRTLNPDALRAERARLHTLPPSQERTAAMRKIMNQLKGIAARSPFRDQA
jgi:hypothetical protein